mmetsp:Transcript_65484/g.122182  ORF Transcript_65484/g.122182 Transcript_65484/m.122182 type:complete len:469 (+) Transcript_65484:62-1468(+)
MAVVNVLPPADTLTTVDPAVVCADRKPPPLNADGSPSELYTYVVKQDPKMVVAPNFVSQEEADHLVSLAEGNWLPSLVGKFEKKEDSTNAPGPKARPRKAQSSTRTSWSCMLRPAQTAIVQRVEHRCAHLAGLPTAQLERLSMVRYSPGQTFGQHHDGGFRPITVFIYLNDLEQEDLPTADGEQASGDTFFPTLGLSFVPRAGCAVMWPNAYPDGSIDNRMLHAGRPPKKGMKYGVNCFFNVEQFRLVCQPEAQCSPEDASPVDLAKLVPEVQSASEIRKLVLSTEPKVVAVRKFASEDEVAHIKGLLKHTDAPPGGIVQVLEIAETQVVHEVEARLAAVVDKEMDKLGRLRVIRSAPTVGQCNRTVGHEAMFVCLDDCDQVYFPKLNLLVTMRAGDLLAWPNQYWHQSELEKTEGVSVQHLRATEDLRTSRYHIAQNCKPALYLEGFIHDRPIRADYREVKNTPSEN